jgi:hypothetical protein
MNSQSPILPPSSPSLSTISSPSFDQIVKGNVTIKKLSKYRYRIIFSKIGKFLQYQVWDKDNANQNDKRIIRYKSAKQWVNSFNESNTNYEKMNKPLFNPTTIMETEDDHIFAFVINNAYFNSSKHLVFTVSTSEISSSSSYKNLIQLPIGCLNNVRFDIDSSDERPFVYFFIGGLRKIYLPTSYLNNLNIEPTAFSSITLNNLNLNFKISKFGKGGRTEYDDANRECYSYFINRDDIRDNYIKNVLASYGNGDAEFIPTNYYFSGSLYKISFSSINFV